MEEGEAKRLGHQLTELLGAAGMANLLPRKRDLLEAFHEIDGNLVNRDSVFWSRSQQERIRHVSERLQGVIVMAKSGTRAVEKALDEGFAFKGAEMVLFTDKSDYKDLIRMFVISDYFCRKTQKERLGEIFDMLKENGAKDAVAKISLCIAMTNSEHEREFGEDMWLGRLGDVYHGMKVKRKIQRLSTIHGRG